MKITVTGILAVALLWSATAAAQLYGPYAPKAPSGPGTGPNPNNNTVGPYTRGDGTFVPQHQRTNPNNTTQDNYGTRPNYNPNNGTSGKRNN